MRLRTFAIAVAAALSLVGTGQAGATDWPDCHFCDICYRDLVTGKVICAPIHWPPP